MTRRPRARLRHATRLRYGLLWALVAGAPHGCGGIDAILEGPPAVEARLSVALESNSISLPQGGQLSVVVTATRVGDFSGPVSFVVERVPVGVTASVEPGTTVGAVTTASVRLQADGTTTLGSFNVQVRVTGKRVNEGAATLILNVVVPPSYALSVSQPSITIARGGIGRVNASIDRVDFNGPVALSVVGTNGISGTVASVTGSAAELTIAVSTSVATGAYPMTIRGTAAGLADRNTGITVVVTDDALQLLGPTQMTAAQLSSVSADFIINHAGYTGAVALTAENLPAGVTAVFQPPAPTGNLTTLVLNVSASAAPGTYPVTIRGSGAGVPDAVTKVQLGITQSGVAMTVVPATITVFQGANVKAALKLVRTTYTGAVAISVSGQPAGLSVVPDVASVTGDTTFLNIVSSPSLPAGTYNVVVRAAPTGLAGSAAKIATLAITVRAAATGGNVLLDWSACAGPDWVAAQDGTDQWVQLTPVAGSFQFSVTMGKGGFAYVEGGNAVTVRYMTQDELTAKPFDMCPTRPSAKTVTGVATHTGPAEIWTYAFGGGVGTSSALNQNFSITDVQPGIHDLVAWTNAAGGYRGVLRRDLDIPDGGSLGGPISLEGPESFPSIRQPLTINGSFVSGETLRHTMSYLTTAACTLNPLYSSGNTNTLSGIPDLYQRLDDYHLLTVLVTGTNGTRIQTLAFHSLNGARSVTVAPSLVAPTVLTVGAPYKRLRADFGETSNFYNRVMALHYVGAARSMTVSATMGYTGSVFSVTMPDLSAVNGWPGAAAIPVAATGNYTVSLEGSSSVGTSCVEGRSTVQLTRMGAY